MKEKGVLLGSPGEGSLTQHHTMCWSIIRMEGDTPVASIGCKAVCSMASRGAGRGLRVSLGLMVCASC